MKCTTVLALSAAYFVAGTAAATATTSLGVEQPSEAPSYKKSTVQGCFKSAGDLVKNSTQEYNSIGKCGDQICQVLGKLVAASTDGGDCYCGDKYPPKDTLVDDSKCNAPCTGYGQDACGGYGYWTVYNTGLELSGVEYSENTTSSSSASSSSTGVTTSVTTAAGGQTVFVTQTNAASSAPASSGSKSSTAGIAAGVVCGVAAAAAAVGGAIFYLRRRRNREIEEEHRRNAAVNSFFGKPPSSSGGFSGSDSRLDPVMVQRRLSDGSIADNEDYSRKILRVTNA